MRHLSLIVFLLLVTTLSSKNSNDIGMICKRISLGYGCRAISNPIIVDESHFGKQPDLMDIIAQHPNTLISLAMDIDCPASCEHQIKNITIDGNGHIIKLKRFPKANYIDVWINNVIFDCSSAEDDFLYAISNGTGSFVVQNCTFVNIKEINLLTARGYATTFIAGNLFKGDLKNDTIYTRATNRVVFVYDAKGEVILEKNTIRDCYGIGIDAIGFNDKMKEGVQIYENTIENVTNGGIVINGGDVWNAEICRNKISNVHCNGTQFGESIDAENSAINVHGFHNLTVEGNMISDCIHGSCFDFDGSDGTDVIAKGSGLKVSGNVCENVCGSALFGVNDVVFENNTMMSVAEKENALNFLSVLGCEDVAIRNNKITTHAPKNGSVYPIYLSNTSKLKSGDIVIRGNHIKSEGRTFLFVNQTFSGLCNLSKNHNQSVNGKSMLTYANNASAEHVRLLDADVVKSVLLKTTSVMPRLLLSKCDDRGGVKEIWIKATREISFQDPITVNLVAKGSRDIILWSASYDTLKKGWTKIPLERYVQNTDSDYYITCSNTNVKSTLKIKVIMENPSAMKYF